MVKYNSDGQQEGLTGDQLKIGIFAGFFLFLIVGGISFFAYAPVYGVWQQEQTGKAELARAEYAKQIAVTEAKAKFDSSILLAQAEVERAKGVAQANKIIGDSLKENEDYLRYLWITDVAGANVDKTVVYVPTETNLPILEATRSSMVENAAKTVGS